MKISNKKIPWIRLLNILSQLLFFIILPGLYVSAFGGLKQLYTSLLHQNFEAAAMLPQLIEVIAIIPVTMLVGRFFCGWMCAFGAMGDFIYFLSSKLMKHRFKLPEKTAKVLSYAKYAVLLFVVAVIWSLDIDLFRSASPWDAFGMLFTVGKLPDFSTVFSTFLPGFLLLVLILIGSFFIERFFCRFLCPLGAVLAVVSKLRITSLLKFRDKCGKCRICTSRCPMGISMYQTDKVKSGECIECFRCVTACPRQNVYPAVTDRDIRPVIVGTAAVASMTGLYYAGTFANAMLSSHLPTAQTDVSSSASSHALYKDGTYTGQANGFRGTTSVSVTIKNDKITDIQVVSYQDDERFFDRARSSVIPSVIKTQSTDVDAVSGATYSSRGILNAVDNALSKALLTGTTDTTASENSSDALSGSSSQSTTATNSTTTQQSTSSTTSSGTTFPTTSAITEGTYQDGTYQGSGRGFRGTTTVSVTVKSGKITDVQILSYRDDERFFDRARSTLIPAVIETQSTDVDAVSGATYSSQGILKAVADALSSAH